MTRRLTLASFLLALALPALALADGSQSYTSPGTYTFTVPAYTSMTVQVWGGGGGGGGGSAWPSGGGGGGGYATQIFSASSLPSTVTVTVGGGGSGGASIGYVTSCDISSQGNAGTAGGGSSFGSYMSAGGGGGGGSESTGSSSYQNGDDAGGVAIPGTGGSGSSESGGLGGSISVSEQFNQDSGGEDSPGYDSSNYYSPTGGGSTSCAGAGGGESSYFDTDGYPNPFGAPGSSGCGGNGGDDGSSGSAPGGGGGGGGDGGEPPGAPGVPAGNECDYNGMTGSGGNGAPGEVAITWTGSGTGSAASSAPTCSISFSPNPMTGDSSTMTWTSSNATLFYINQVGYVGASGSAQVYAAGDYSGSVSGSGGSGSCPATLGSSGTTGIGTTGNSNGTGSGGNGGAGGTLTENGIQVSACSIGYAQEGTTCVFTSCPANYTEESDQNGNPECILNSCSAGYICQDGNQYYESASCQVSSSPTETCGYGCQSGACLPPPSPEIAAWQVKPVLLQGGQTSTVDWQAENVTSCTITGTNGDSWTGLSGDKTTSPITGQTIYTILCQGESGSTPPSATDSTTINIVPTFEEE